MTTPPPPALLLLPPPPHHHLLIAQDYLQHALLHRIGPNHEFPTIQDFIGQFQSHHSVPSLEAGLHLTDALGISRGEVFRSTAQSLLVKILDTFKGAEAHAKIRLLEQALPFIGVPELHEVSLALLSSLPPAAIPESTLERLLLMLPTLSPPVAARIPGEVIVKAWEAFPQRFIDFASTRIDNHINSLAMRKSLQESFNLYKEPTKRRRDPIKDLIDSIGNSQKLYATVSSLIRTRFVDTNNIALCTLQLDVIELLSKKSIDAVKPIVGKDAPPEKLMEAVQKALFIETRKLATSLGVLLLKFLPTPENIDDQAARLEDGRKRLRKIVNETLKLIYTSMSKSTNSTLPNVKRQHVMDSSSSHSTTTSSSTTNATSTISPAASTTTNTNKSTYIVDLNRTISTLVTEFSQMSEFTQFEYRIWESNPSMSDYTLRIPKPMCLQIIRETVYASYDDFVKDLQLIPENFAEYWKARLRREPTIYRPILNSAKKLVQELLETFTKLHPELIIAPPSSTTSSLQSTTTTSPAFVVAKPPIPKPTTIQPPPPPTVPKKVPSGLPRGRPPIKRNLLLGIPPPGSSSSTSNNSAGGGGVSHTPQPPLEPIDFNVPLRITDVIVDVCMLFGDTCVRSVLIRLLYEFVEDLIHQAKLPREDNEVIALLWLIRIGEEAHTVAKTSRTTTTTPEQDLRETLLVFKYHGMNQSSTDELLQDGQHNILVTSDVYNAIPNFARILWGIEEEDAKMTYLDDDFIQLVRSNTVLSDLLVRYVFTRTLTGDEEQAALMLNPQLQLPERYGLRRSLAWALAQPYKSPETGQEMFLGLGILRRTAMEHVYLKYILDSLNELTNNNNNISSTSFIEAHELFAGVLSSEANLQTMSDRERAPPHLPENPGLDRSEILDYLRKALTTVTEEMYAQDDFKRARKDYEKIFALDAFASCRGEFHLPERPVSRVPGSRQGYGSTTGGVMSPPTWTGGGFGTTGTYPTSSQSPPASGNFPVSSGGNNNNNIGQSPMSTSGTYPNNSSQSPSMILDGLSSQ
jgi:hypothetical protein